MYIPVTPEICPVLAADTRNKWRQIGNEYYQTDEKEGVCLEIRHVESGLYRWWLYDANSADPDIAITLDDAKTLPDALYAVYEYLDGYQRTRIMERLEYLRGQLRAEQISYGELCELQCLADYIDPGDVELLEAAGVPGHKDSE